MKKKEKNKEERKNIKDMRNKEKRSRQGTKIKKKYKK